MNAKVAGIFVLLVILCLFLAMVVPDAFLKGNNIENLLRRTSLYGVLGIGVAFVIITGGIDLSVGSVVCLSACLLTLFLEVEYTPPDEQQVIEVKATEQTIVVPGEVQRFKPGSHLRFYGGRRARNALLTVTRVESTLDAQGNPATALYLDAALSRDDSAGKIATVYQIERVTAEVPGKDAGHASSQVELAGSPPALRPRDRIWLVHPESGLKQLTITAVRTQEATTLLDLDEPIPTVNEEWLAIPLQRNQRMSVAAALAAVMLVALLLGLAHGLLVTKLGLQPFVVTLCGLLFYRGISRWLVNDQTMGFGDEYESSLSPLGAGKLLLWRSADGGDSFGIPYPFFILLLTAVLAALFLNKTIWGRYMLALGRNEAAARYSGINTGRVTVMAYMISTGLAVVGGLLFALDANSVAPSSFGNFFELYAIAAAVLGGCSLRGGEGSILGVVIGTALMQTLYNLIVLLKVSDTLEFAIIGAVILAGVTADEIVKRLAAKRRALAQARAAG